MLTLQCLSQLRAVAAACASEAASGVTNCTNSTKFRRAFTLLQGPPGTGKSAVIMLILNFLHLMQVRP
jgi:DNA replication protein DnaC